VRGLLIATLAAIVALSGCVQPQPHPPVAPPTSAVPPTVATPATPEATPASPAAAETGNNPPVVPPALPDENASAKRPAPPPAARSPAKAATSSPAESSTPVSPPIAVTESARPPAPPPLDLSALEQRLRDTNAIGVFTKLSLKNQVDDLVAQFRGFYKGQVKVPLAELRQRYELLLLKVVTLLQDTDQQLANAINSSREAIWDILADPEKFARI
jgi:hypothetical protein